MLSRFLQTTSSRLVRSSAVTLSSAIVNKTVARHPSLPRLPAVGSASSFLPYHQHQQERYNWTKAKKKRFERKERRKKMAEQGIELPKPPYYTPIEPVVNAVDREAQRVAIAAKDAEVAAALHQRMARQKEQPPVLRYHMAGLKMSDRVRKLFDLSNGNQAEVVRAQKQQGMELFQLREGDTGSTPVQIIALTTRIQQLQAHMAKHKKDKHSKRGMDALFVRRRKLLDYLERKDFDSYRSVVKTLGLMR